MGKTTRWFRALLGAKKSTDSHPEAAGSDSRLEKERKRWGAVRSSNGGTRGCTAEVSSSSSYVEQADANKHAIAVAAATAAVAEAALAAAKAAAEVVRLTSGGGPPPVYFSGSERRREWAAVKIQSAFRAYLARRALRALKGLVKLQALVRGHIVRKQSANMLRRMQAMARIQARASASRAFMSESPYSSSKSFQSHNSRYGAKSNINDIIDVERKRSNSNWLDRWMEEFAWDGHRNAGCGSDEKSDKILEVDTWKPHFISELGNLTSQSSKHVPCWNYYEPGFMNLESLSRHTTKSYKANPSLSSGEVLSMKSVRSPTNAETAARTAESSPQMYSALSRPGSSASRGPFTSTRSECMQNYFSGYSSHPNYMANTESSRAKVRSQSAPRQRMQFETPGSSSTKRSLHGIWNADTHSEAGFDLHATVRSKAYPGMSRLHRLGTPAQGGVGSVNGGRS